jgi:hypothetical protein
MGIAQPSPQRPALSERSESKGRRERGGGGGEQRTRNPEPGNRKERRRQPGVVPGVPGRQAEGLRQSSLGRRPRWRRSRKKAEPCRGETTWRSCSALSGLGVKKDYALLAPAYPGRWPGLRCLSPSGSSANVRRRAFTATLGVHVANADLRKANNSCAPGGCSSCR